MIICPICEKEQDMEVEYPTLEIVGHFLQNHAELMTKAQKEIGHWSEWE